MRSNGMTQTSASSRSDGVAGVMVIHDAIQTNDFTGHLESCDLVATIFCRHAGLEEARANGIQRGESFSVAEKRSAARLILRRTATTSSMRCSCSSLSPTGMQSSRRLQLEQATLMVSGFMAQKPVGCSSISCSTREPKCLAQCLEADDMHQIVAPPAAGSLDSGQGRRG